MKINKEEKELKEQKVILDFQNKNSIFIENENNNWHFYDNLNQKEIDNLFSNKVFSNFKKIDQNWENDFSTFTRDQKWNIKDNLIIKGDNLFVLHSLKSNFAWKIKLIYIDPPYNTKNNNFLYEDNFNRSTWLIFMKNRLEVAKELLSEDWVLFIQCDDNEQAYLKVLMNEIFWEKNKLTDIILKVKNMAGVAWWGEEIRIRDLCEVIISYTKDISKFSWFKNLDFLEEIPQEEYKKYKVLTSIGNIKNKKIIDNKEIFVRENIKIETIEDLLKNMSFADILKKYKGFIFKETFKNQSSIRDFVLKNSNSNDELVEVKYLVKSGQFKWQDISVFYTWKVKRFIWMIDHKIFIKNNKVYYKKNLWNLWDDISWNWIGNEGWVKLNNWKKPEKLLKRIIEISTNPGDIVLDFFLGSWTTCAVAHKLNRQYIGIEKMDYIKELPYKRLKNVIWGEKTGISKETKWNGGWEFVFMELLTENNYILDKIKNIKDIKELETIYLNIKNNNKMLFNNLIQVDLNLEEVKKKLLDIIEKNTIYKTWNKNLETWFSDQDKKNNDNFYLYKNI